VTPVDRSRLPAVGPSPSVRFAAIHKDRLNNRLALWSAEHRGLPVLTFLLVLPSGSAADFEGYEGLAAITADMLDEGSGDRSAIDINAAFARIGAHLDTDVSSDATVLTVTCLARFAQQALSLMADCVVRPRLLEADFDRLRELRLTRLVQIRDMASAVADRAFMQLVYGAHPYAHMALGTEEALRQMTIDDVRAFHQRLYGPSAATLVAAGDIAAGNVREMVEDAFGSWANPGAQALSADAALVPPPAEPAHRLALVNKTSAAQSEIRIGEVGLTRNTPDFHPLIVLNMILGGQFVSRINMKLRQEKGLTYGARTTFDFRRGRGPFILQTSVQSDSTAVAVQEAIGEILAIRTDRPPTEHEVEMAKAALTRGYARNFETAEQVARAMSQLMLFGLPDDYFDTFIASVSQVDTEVTRHVASIHLDPSKLATAIVADAVLVGPQLARAGLGEPVPLLPRL
jgi:zinc protease